MNNLIYRVAHGKFEATMLPRVVLWNLQTPDPMPSKYRLYSWIVRTQIVSWRLQCIHCRRPSRTHAHRTQWAIKQKREKRSKFGSVRKTIELSLPQAQLRTSIDYLTVRRYLPWMPCAFWSAIVNNYWIMMGIGCPFSAGEAHAWIILCLFDHQSSAPHSCFHHLHYTCIIHSSYDPFYLQQKLNKYGSSVKFLFRHPWCPEYMTFHFCEVAICGLDLNQSCEEVTIDCDLHSTHFPYLRASFGVGKIDGPVSVKRKRVCQRSGTLPNTHNLMR